MTETTREAVNRLKSKGLISGNSGVGLHMHLDAADPPDKADVINTMRGYGVPVYITELDVNLRNVSGSPEQRYATQAKIFREAVEACLESGVCRSITFWDIGDKYSWIETDKGYSKYSPVGDPTPFDDDLQPKPAYFAVKAVLQKQLSK
jgi:endo-1,4-beta-xylanase